MDDSDSALIGRFAEQHDQAAFAVLVGRHSPLVLGVCRRVLEDLHDTEDAAQAAFLVLARHAVRLDRRLPLGPWLYQVALNLARNALRDRRTRERAHHEAAAMSQPRLPPSSFEAEIDAAMASLPERERSAITLCHLQGRPAEEVAELVGRPVGTIYVWLSRGRERLRLQLIRRGVGVSAVFLVSALGGLSATEVPAGFAAATAASATAFLTNAGAATPAAALASQGIKTMGILNAAKTTLIAASLIVTVGAAGWIAAAESGGGGGGGGGKGSLLGATGFLPNHDHPVGWRGDWTGRYPGATPPLVWSRRAVGITAQIRYQGDKPAGAEPGKGSQALEYFTIKDWLVAGPFAVGDPVKDLDQDQLGGEAAVMPAKDAKAGTATWKYLRADVATQSHHECNNGTCGNSNVDFVYAFGTFAGADQGLPIKISGDFTNKVAYAHTYIYSPADARMQLQLPFDGKAGRFWLNGKPTDLDTKNRGRNYDIALVKGWNRLLVKISTDNGLPGAQSFSRWLVAAYLPPTLPVTYETKNVAWMTKMTGRSMSQPIVVGDRIYVGSGISDLLCLDKKSGKVLWLHSNTPYDAMTADERAAVPGMKEKIEPLAAALEARNNDLMTAINAGVSAQGLSSTEQAAVDAKSKDKLTAERALLDAFYAADRKKYPQLYLNEVASSNATPVSDGVHVWWACGGAQYVDFPFMISCFDLDGKRTWSRFDTSMRGGEHGSHLSPALVDDKLVFGCGSTRIAYDAKTGMKAWRNDDTKDWTNAAKELLPVRLAAGSAIISGKSIYRASDGTVVGPSNVAKIFTDQTSIVDNGIIYSYGVFQGHGKPPSFVAVKLDASGKTDVLWAPEGKDVWMPVRHSTIAESYSVSSPLLVDGLIYFVDMSGGLAVLDPAGKKCLSRQWLDGYNRFTRFTYGVVACPTLGGKNIFITDDAGYTHVLQPGPQFKELGTNVLENVHQTGMGGNPCHQESFYTSPWFEGKCMYLRGEEYVYCISEK